ncbi:5-formyltetrahydrofolate cyclo-ligase [Litoreibacter roseus]|uniref:5-formyltetrahydrofolate cyclo-ligase n=1 Tax=Litoreibacter roseus TaxID=2601869 RepID=A0A6N6JJN6_9RHOB|nr:5-formyltetrahydrofolate cyclo-ligase [Litoreibacter roseus]GFE65659.1 5-formyltetrahydrofolate cyclo-ligase [Litoreibacter roseus]
MTDQADQKARARRAAFARRKTAKSIEHDDAACGHLLEVLRTDVGKPVAGYMPIRTEVDPRPAMAAMARTGPVGVPVIEAADTPLRFRRWTPDSEMIDGPFGAKVPVSGSWITPAVLIVPLLAFDRSGARLGYGGGFYDRTLALLRQTAPALAVGFAFSAQEADALPTEPTDERLDMVVTEAGVIRF